VVAKVPGVGAGEVQWRRGTRYLGIARSRYAVSMVFASGVMPSVVVSIF
jgi:hypothetical protein